MRVSMIALMIGLSTPALAAENLGLTGTRLSLGARQDEAGNKQLESAVAVVNVAITQIHGFQGDLSFSDTEGGGIGRIGGHVFMNPNGGTKYGLFGSLNDLGGADFVWGTFGAEVMFDLGRNMVAEVHGGIGYGSQSLDYAFAGVGVNYSLSDSLTVGTHFDVTSFQEETFGSNSYEVSLDAHFQRPGDRFGAYSDVTYSSLSGAGNGGGATRIGRGVTMDLGTISQKTAKTRLWRNYDPVATLVRRDLFFVRQ